MATAEQLEVSNFLGAHPPFDELPLEALEAIAQQVEVAYFRAGSDILRLAEPIQDLYIVRSGAVECYRRDGELFNRLAEGDVFGQSGLLLNRRVRFPVRALEDTLVYCVPAELFHDYCYRFETFADFFDQEDGAQLRQAISTQTDNNDLTTVKVKTLLYRDLVTVAKNTAVRDAAIQMTEEKVSSLLITDPDRPISDDPRDDDGQVVGIITDRDLRRRVLAEGLPVDVAIDQVMSTDLIVLDDDAYVFEAVLVMLRNNVHHLPVVHHKRPIGVLSLSDILRHESQSSLLMVRGIFGQQSIEELQTYAEQLPSVFVRMVNEDANSHMIGSAMSVIGRSFKQRLLELAEAELGPPPVPYCFLALGSMARDEQLLVSDQDNAIILDDSYQQAVHGDYFARLAEFVCNGLAACGYAYCTGEIMATNPKWRMTRNEWQACFSHWIEQPSPAALLHSSIFFDLDGVWGKTAWASELQKLIAQQARVNPRFLACLARNALNRTPPLGFFKDFVMEQDGEHRKSINLKRRGTAPLSDVVRVHALAVGSRAQNSFERLDDIAAADILPPGKARDISDALEYISMVRIRHQALDVENSVTPDNNIEPENLSSFEKRNLKEAFLVVSNAQNFLKFRYTANRQIK